MRISDWSSDVCSSDLRPREHKSHGSGGDFIEAQSFSIFCRRKQAENVVGASGRQAIIDLRLDIGTNFCDGLYASADRSLLGMRLKNDLRNGMRPAEEAPRVRVGNAKETRQETERHGLGQRSEEN